ncbi:glutamate 5-kinase [Bradyrhizobium cenepequi]|uniref:glutamate 5-kinase n=1 Tax=Bradyrhizobium cenepequi TaxID=2821403 RepID=UPI001CE30FBB|nr:glutamate 5-kinase [Bradyrhizobium cenepequi]
MLASARRIVVKVGSALIVDQATGTIRERWLEMLVEDIARLQGRGQDVAVVSSGAVAIGRHALDLHHGMLAKKDRRAAAAVGQMNLTRTHRELFARHRLTTAQVLLTLEDTTERQRMLNVRATLTRLLTFRTIPVLNENDAVATNAPSFGDNDHLAARVAKLVGSDTLVLLSNVAGLYSADPHESPSAVFIREVHELTPEIERMAGGARSDHSSGGMVTKLAAARLALASGFTMIIADGRNSHPLSAIDAGEPCTWFHPSTAARMARKTWIGGTLKPAGILVVNNSAAMQMRLGRGLCVEGVISFDGDFARGDAVVMRDVHGNEVARGLSIYSSIELRCIDRRSGPETGCPLACCELDQIVHSDDLALTE